MLQSMRTYAASWVVKGLFVILIGSFALWGIGDYVSRPPVDRTLADVGPAKIEVPAFQARLREVLEAIRLQRNQILSSEQIVAQGIHRQVLDDLVVEALFDQGAGRLGLAAPESLMRQRIVSDRAFQDAAGNFDRLRFEQIMRSRGLSEEALVADLRVSLKREHLVSALIAGVTAPAPLVSRVEAYRQERRVVETITVGSADQQVADPSEAEIAEWHERNRDRFRTPERRDIEAIVLSPDEMAEAIAVPEERLAAAYEERRQLYVTPEKRNLRQMLLGDEEKAKAAAARLAGGADFAAVAREVAGLDEAALPLGSLSSEDLPAELAGPVFAAAAGAVVGPLQSAFGWHLIKVDEIQPEVTRDLASVRQELTREVAREEALNGIYEVMNKLEDEIAAGGAIAQIATTLGLPLRALKGIDAAGRDAAGAPVPGLPRSAGFLAAAFDTPAGGVSPVGELDGGGYYVLRVDAVTPSVARPLAEVKGEVVEAMRRERREAAARARAEALQGEVAAGKPMAAVAEAAGLPLVQSEPFTRLGQGLGGASPLLVGPAFRLKPGDSEIVATATGAVLLRLKEVLPQAAPDPATTTALAGQLRSGLSSDLLAAFAEGLRAEFPVRVNERVLSQLFASP
ncbi:MAG: peptidylprolyl isomerase [Thalassobaculales bacterium]